MKSFPSVADPQGAEGTLRALRLFSALGVLVCLLSWSRDAFFLAGRHAILDPEVAYAFNAGDPLSIANLVPSSFVRLPVYDYAVFGVILFTGLCAILCVFNLSGFVAALGMYLGLRITKTMVPLFFYGAEEFLLLLAFYGLFAPAGGWFAPAARSAPPRAVAVPAALAFRAHLAMAYLLSGLEKGSGPAWWTGESLWRALYRTDLSGQRLAGVPLEAVPAWVFAAVGVSVVLVETFYPCFLFGPKRRQLLLVTVGAMHFSIGLFLGLWFFAGIMIAANLAALAPWAEWARNGVGTGWFSRWKKERQGVASVPSAARTAGTGYFPPGEVRGRTMG